MATNKSLIVLQENSGKVDLPEGTSAALRDIIYAIADGLAETFEDVKTTLQSATRYDTVHLLTDNLCSRARLLDALIAETKEGPDHRPDHPWPRKQRIAQNENRA